jgi:hypothetical protein
VIARNWWSEFASAAGFERTFAVDRLGPMAALSPGVDVPGPRTALSFAPPGNWAATTKTDVTLMPDGHAPDLRGMSAFIQGRNHAEMLPRPITFHLTCTAPSQFQVQVGAVARAGAHPTLALDGQIVQEADYPAAPQDQDVDRSLSLNVPTGSHTVALSNTGPDWFTVTRIVVTDYVPSIAALAKGNAKAAVFWAYARDRVERDPTIAALTLPGLAPGNYQIRLWDTRAGQMAETLSAVASAKPLTVRLPSFTGDIAGVVIRQRLINTSAEHSKRRPPVQSR